MLLFNISLVIIKSLDVDNSIELEAEICLTVIISPTLRSILSIVRVFLSIQIVLIYELFI